MRNVLALVAVLGSFCCLDANAFPVGNPLGTAASPLPVENVKVICHEDGRCYRPPTRRPVARWVYGDNNFVGPYDGPGYYGNPRYRYNWWPFWW